MKSLKLNYFATLLAVVLLSSCGGLTKMKDAASEINYTVSPKPLEVHGGEVELTIETKFPPKYFNKKAVLTATPAIVYEGGEEAYETTTVQGESVQENNKVISYEGGSFTYSGKVPYKEAMLVSSLEMRLGAKVGDQTVEFPGIKIADGVISTSQLAETDPKAIAVGDNFVRVLPENVEADIHYQIQRSNIDSKELKAEDIKAMKDAIEAAKTNDRKEFKGVSVSAYASPDGSVELNTNLAEDRQKSSETYIKNELKKAKVDAEGDEFFSLMSTPEDWDGFKSKMEKSDIQDKELVLRVLSMYSDPEVREREIKNIAEAFEDIKVKVLPELRRAKLTINIDKVGYSDEELKEIAMSNPDTLNVEELLYAANLFESNDDKLKVYQTAATNFGDDVRTNNNLGYVLYQQGKLAQAKEAFEKAKAVDNNDVVKNNLGAVALKEGDVAGAEELFTSATGAGKVVNYNMGIIKLQQGDYKAAVSYFGNTAEFNTALAQLLNGENDAALATLGKVEDDDAMVYYLKAVSGARSQKEDIVLNNLKTAIGKDAGLKDYAKKDLEFRAYRANDSFTSIVE
ncbi:MAG: tetratricopeptide repeat protein [Bacteroidales bacterium]|nr:tetratricopeptide repeat protein [Bacteroidales bacterium]